jgi:hypothetical protein
VLLSLLGALRREDVQELIEILDRRRCQEQFQRRPLAAPAC